MYFSTKSLGLGLAHLVDGAAKTRPTAMEQSAKEGDLGG
jgi:hypothetical protein